MKITIINVGSNNLMSVAKVIKFLGYDFQIANTPDQILLSEKIILPGISSFDNLMSGIIENNIYKALKQQILVNQVPLLAICAGMQILANDSAEGNLKGLGIIDATCLPLEKNNNTFPSPHHGWDKLYSSKNNKSTIHENRYYFCHSYYMQVKNEDIVDKWAFYGLLFPAIIKKNNITAIQFHPEKSLEDGINLINKFCIE